MGVSDAMKYPMNEEGWVQTMAIGTVLKLCTFLILPRVLLQGYYVRVMRRTVAGDPEPPGFDNWSGLLHDGIRASLIILVYLAIPLLVFFLFAVPPLIGIVGSVMSGSGPGIGASLAGLAGALLVSGLLVVVFGYAGAAGMAAFAHNGTMRAAFSRDVLAVMTSSNYLVAHINVLIVSIAASIFTSVVTAVVAFIPVVNLLLLVVHPFVLKYVWVVWSRLWADAYAEALDISPDRREPATTRPV